MQIFVNDFDPSRIGAMELFGGPNSSGPSKLALNKHNHAFSSFSNPLLPLKYNLGPSDADVKFGIVPFLVALMPSRL